MGISPTRFKKKLQPLSPTGSKKCLWIEELRDSGIEELKAILFWKGKRRFPFQTDPFLVIHPAAELRGILSIKLQISNKSQ